MLQRIETNLVEFKACRLGDESKLEQHLIADGLLKREGDTYKVYSSESASLEEGQKAPVGFWVKVDDLGHPYPNDPAVFVKKNEPVNAEEGVYRKKMADYPAFILAEGEDPMSEPIIRWMVEHGKLTINAETPDKFYSAELWGTQLTTSRNGAVLFYKVEKDDAGEITEVDFNFVDEKVLWDLYHTM